MSNNTLLSFDAKVHGLTPLNVVIPTTEGGVEQQIEKLQSIPTSLLVNTVTQTSDVISDASNIDSQRKFITQGQTTIRRPDPIILYDTAPMIGQSSLEASFVLDTVVDTTNTNLSSLDVPESYRRGH